MVKGLQRSLSRAPRGKRDIVKERISLAGDTIAVAGTTGVGFGSVALGSFPEGNILLLGATLVDLVLTGNGVDHTATFDGDVGVGTTAADDATITAADVNVIGSTALGAATANVSPTIAASNATPVMIDNTANDQDLYLNLLIDDAATDGDGGIYTAAGEIWIAYTMMGDD